MFVYLFVFAHSPRWEVSNVKELASSSREQRGLNSHSLSAHLLRVTWSLASTVHPQLRWLFPF